MFYWGSEPYVKQGFSLKPRVSWEKVRFRDKNISYLECKKDDDNLEKIKNELTRDFVTTLGNLLLPSKSKQEISQKLDGFFEYLNSAMLPFDQEDTHTLIRKANRTTLKAKLQPWCANLAMNAKFERSKDAHSTQSLYGKFKDVPAFILAAGPSLDNNIKQLQAIRDKCVIICVDTSLKPSIANGVEPDICITHDANHAGARYFMPTGYFGSVDLNHMPWQMLMYLINKVEREKGILLPNTVGCFVNYVSPLTIASYNGLRAFYSVYDPGLPVYEIMKQNTELRQIDENLFKYHQKGSIIGGSSVGHVAIYLALNMGCDPISILGMDLSYPGKQSHATGSVNMKDLKQVKTFPIQDIMGREVRTNMSMFSYAKVVENMIPEIILQTGVRFFNCTEDPQGNPAGIIFRGPEPKKLKDVISEYCIRSYDINTTIKDIIIKN